MRQLVGFIQALGLLAAAMIIASSPAAARPLRAHHRIPAYITAAVASPLRPGRDVMRDAGQKPAELLAFAGVKPGDRIADFWPVPPYSTGLLSLVAGPQGHVYAIVPAKLIADVPDAERRVRGDLEPFAGNVTLQIQPFDRFEVPEPLDVVWMGKIYHDFPNRMEMGPLDIDAVNRAVFNALKPGGVLIIIDHAAPRGSGFRDVEPDDARRLHRIDPDIVKAQVMAAGFQLVGESHVLANADDDHSLSPFDPRVRDRTDRFVLKFRKPLH